MIKNGAKNLTLEDCMAANKNFGVVIGINDGKDLMPDVEPGVYVNLLGVLVIE